MSYQNIDLEKYTPFEHLLALIVGEEKTGKSWLASTAPKPILFLDTDSRAASIAGRPGVYARSFREAPYPMQPTVAPDILDSLTQLEKSLDLSEMGFDVPKGTVIKTLVLDSISTIARAAMQYDLYTTSGIRREISIAGKFKVSIPANWDAWNAEIDFVEKLVLRAAALPVHLICILHETEEKAAGSTPEKPTFTGKITVYPERYARLLKYFNEVWRVKLTPKPNPKNPMLQVPTVQTRPDY
ncbi:MAG: AAA family ATPase, partial [Candidatus Acidiferrales bacterium]